MLTYFISKVCVLIILVFERCRWANGNIICNEYKGDSEDSNQWWADHFLLVGVTCDCDQLNYQIVGCFKVTKKSVTPTFFYRDIIHPQIQNLTDKSW